MAKRTARPMPEVREPRHQAAREDLRRPHRPGRGQRSIDRIHRRWPTAHLVHLPLHASWLSQVEIYFSVLQRKVLTPTTSRARRKSPRGSPRSRTTTSRSLPFEWKFGRRDLDRMLAAASSPAPSVSVA
jgi:hypothetical protein